MQPVAGATGKRFDELGGRRLQTRLGGAKLRLARAGRICPDLCASRLVRSTATHCDGPLDLEPNPPRQNGSNLRLDALKWAVSRKILLGVAACRSKINSHAVALLPRAPRNSSAVACATRFALSTAAGGLKPCDRGKPVQAQRIEGLIAPFHTAGHPGIANLIAGSAKRLSTFLVKRAMSLSPLAVSNEPQ